MWSRFRSRGCVVVAGQPGVSVVSAWCWCGCRSALCVCGRRSVSGVRVGVDVGVGVVVRMNARRYLSGCRSLRRCPRRRLSGRLGSRGRLGCVWTLLLRAVGAGFTVRVRVGTRVRVGLGCGRACLLHSGLLLHSGRPLVVPLHAPRAIVRRLISLTLAGRLLRHVGYQGCIRGCHCWRGGRHGLLWSIVLWRAASSAHIFAARITIVVKIA